MFTASHPFGPFDLLRVPYDVVPTTAHPDRRTGPLLGRMTVAGADDGESLTWIREGAVAHAGVFDVAGCLVAGRVHGDLPEPLPHAGNWRVLCPVTDEHGAAVASVWRHDHGDVWLPFDPGAVMQCLWSEGYHRLRRGTRLRSDLRLLAVRGYYAVRPVLPRRVQLLARRRLARGPTASTTASTASGFPGWPIHSGLHDLYDWLLELVGDLAGTAVPWIAPWPDGARWCFVLTHDVETGQGLADLDLLREPERRGGYVSSWNFVPLRYPTPPETVTALTAEGCEVGVHGLRHDGRDLASARSLRRRLPGIRAAAEHWGAVGFRSPATQRSWALMPRLGFDYDSSYTDTDPYEPQPGGCCTWWPFTNSDLVELPITLPQDHTLYSILGHRDESLWVDKAHELRRRGALVLVLSHPDYAHGSARAAWESLLEEFRDDPTMWQPLAREAAAWWRARSGSRLVATDDGWQVEGPGAGRAQVSLSAGIHTDGADR